MLWNNKKMLYRTGHFFHKAVPVKTPNGPGLAYYRPYLKLFQDERLNYHNFPA